MSFTSFSKLRAIIENIGVNYAEQTVQRKEALWSGEIIRGKNDVIVTSQGLFEILPDGSVIRVIVHAPQGPYQSRDYPEEGLMEDPISGWHKYHVVWCSTVAEWKRNLRKTNRNDGKFTYPLFWRNGTEYRPELRDGGRPLHLCKNCAGQIRRHGIHASVDDFDVRSFLSQEQLGSSFGGLSLTSDYDLIPNVYSHEWPQISRRFKEGRNWTCEKCYQDLSQARKFLHAHHRDRNKANNSIFNLQALCIRCHAREHPENDKLAAAPDLQEYDRLFQTTLVG